MSFNRQRQLALVLLDAIADLTGVRPPSLTAIASEPAAESLRIHSTEIGGAVHDALHPFEGYTTSEYLGPDVASGTVRNGIRHEDLLATSFEDSSIDILVSADVFEHIPEPYEAHREVHRILRPGGHHIFTVPSNMAMPFDEQRAAVVDGRVHLYAPPEYHGPTTDALLVYTIFGAEMIDHLAALGYRCTVRDMERPEAGCAGPGAIVFDASRVSEPTGAVVPSGARPDRRAPLRDEGPGLEQSNAARARFDAGDVEGALEAFMACTDEFGPTPRALIGVADCATALGDRTTAIGVLELTLEHWPWRWDAEQRREDLLHSVAT
ncbi:MAG: class I SAM-dependent methyltransferase [Acidimicrobiales bacterium]